MARINIHYLQLRVLILDKLRELHAKGEEFSNYTVTLALREDNKGIEIAHETVRSAMASLFSTMFGPFGVVERNVDGLLYKTQMGKYGDEPCRVYKPYTKPAETKPFVTEQEWERKQWEAQHPTGVSVRWSASK